MIWKKIVDGSRLDIYVIEEYENEIRNWAKMWTLVKAVGERFPLFFNEQKFHMIKKVKCRLFEFKPDLQTRYFAQLEGNKMMIYYKVIKKKDSLKIKEYNSICDAYFLLR